MTGRSMSLIMGSIINEQAAEIINLRAWITALEAENARLRATLLLRVHGPEDCHICHMPKVGPGKSICSYPHAMLPERAVDPAHPEGFWTWLPVESALNTDSAGG